MRNYVEARRRDPEFQEYYIILFMEYETPIEIPCPRPGPIDDELILVLLKVSPTSPHSRVVSYKCCFQKIL